MPDAPKAADPGSTEPDRSGLIGNLKSKIFAGDKSRGGALSPELVLRRIGPTTEARANSGGAPAARPDSKTASPAILATPARSPDPAQAAPQDQDKGEAVKEVDMEQLSSLEVRFTELQIKFNELSGRLSETAGFLRDAGVPPAEALIADMASCRRTFESLSRSVVDRAQALAVPSRHIAGTPSSIGDLRSLLEVTSFHHSQKRAVATLEHVLGITHPGGEFPPLAECQAKARQLLDAVKVADWPAGHPDSEALAQGRHAFSKLLTMVERGQDLNDEQWAVFQDAVTASFGRQLAIAASRGKLQMGGNGSANGAARKAPARPAFAAPPPAAPGKAASQRCPACKAEVESGGTFCGECGTKVA